MNRKYFNYLPTLKIYCIGLYSFYCLPGDTLLAGYKNSFCKKVGPGNKTRAAAFCGEDICRPGYWLDIVTPLQ